MNTQDAQFDARPPQRERARWLGVFARVVVGGLFIYAAWNKIADPMHFVEEVQAYELAPLAVTHVIAFILPWLEMICAVMLITCLWRGEARFLIFAMLLVFTIGKISVEIRGLDIDCGCWGNDWMEQTFSGIRGILLNVGMMILLGADYLVARSGRKRTPSGPPASNSTATPRPVA